MNNQTDIAKFFNRIEDLWDELVAVRDEIEVIECSLARLKSNLTFQSAERVGPSDHGIDDCGNDGMVRKHVP